jgi:Flp pilus assembly pilin Flp
MMERLLSLYIAAWTVRNREEGQTAVEYALVLALVAIVLAVALGTGLTGALTPTINKIKAALS